MAVDAEPGAAGPRHVRDAEVLAAVDDVREPNEQPAELVAGS